MNSNRHLSVEDEYYKIIKRLKKVIRVLVAFMTVSVILNALSLYYMKLSDPTISVVKILTGLKTGFHGLYKGLVK